MRERSSISDGGSRGPVLLVEPDGRARAEASGWLTTAGYVVRDTATFQEARQMLEAAAPVVLVTALRLGAFNGLHLIIAARALQPELRAIVTAGADDEILQVEARRLGATCLVRPMSRQMLLDALGAALSTPARP